MITTRQDKVKATIAKLEARLQKYLDGGFDKKYAKCDKETAEMRKRIDIDVLKDNIYYAKRKLNKAIAADQREEERNVKKALKQTITEKLEAAIPQCLKGFEEHICKLAVESEIRRYEYYKEQEWPDFNDYSEYAQNVRYYQSQYSEEKMKKETRTSAHALILNLMRRVLKKVGTITDATELRLEEGNWKEGVAINGSIKGKNGSVRVWSIMAGGYNIQKLHVRVLCK